MSPLKVRTPLESLEIMQPKVKEAYQLINMITNNIKIESIPIKIQATIEVKQEVFSRVKSELILPSTQTSIADQRSKSSD